MKTQKYIAIAGNMGSGKSSLVQFLVQQYNVKPFYEPNEQNPYLPKFYQDMDTWAFHSQLFFLAHKFRTHKDLEKTAGHVILDRTIYEDAEVFATALYQSGKINSEDYQTYQTLYQTICQTLKPPHLMIYLKCSFKTLKKRIQMRGRTIEHQVPDAYLRQLEKLYDNWISRYNASEVIVIETDKLDYITDLVDRIDVMKRIEKLL